MVETLGGKMLRNLLIQGGNPVAFHFLLIVCCVLSKLVMFWIICTHFISKLLLCRMAEFSEYDYSWSVYLVEYSFSTAICRNICHYSFVILKYCQKLLPFSKKSKWPNRKKFVIKLNKIVSIVITHIFLKKMFINSTKVSFTSGDYLFNPTSNILFLWTGWHLCCFQPQRRRFLCQRCKLTKC